MDACHFVIELGLELRGGISLLQKPVKSVPVFPGINCIIMNARPMRSGFVS